MLKLGWFQTFMALNLVVKINKISKSAISLGLLSIKCKYVRLIEVSRCFGVIHKNPRLPSTSQ